MIYVQIPEKHDAKGFLLLAKSGAPVSCLPRNIYGVSPEHVKILKRKRIPFKKLPAKSIHFLSLLWLHEKIRDLPAIEI
jgi:hypothetical protein